MNVNKCIQTIGEKGGGNFIAGSVVYNLNRSKYGKRLVQSTARDYGNARWLGKANGMLIVVFQLCDSYIISKLTHQKGRISRTRSRKLKYNFKSQGRRFRSTGRERTSSGRTRFQWENNLCVRPRAEMIYIDLLLAWPSREEGYHCQGAAKESDDHPCQNQ